MLNHEQPPTVVVPSSSSVPASFPSSVMDYDSMVHQGSNLREYFHILLKRKWLIIITFLIVFLTVAIYTLSRTPIFRSTAMLQITQDNPASRVGVDDKLSQLTGSGDLEKFQQTQYKIIQSWSLAQRVMQVLNLKKPPDIEVTPIKNSFLVEVAFQDPDKFIAQKVVNAVANEYMFLSIDRRNESLDLVRKWLDKQLQGMAAKVQKAQKKLYKFGQKTDIYTMEDKDNVIVQKFIDLSSLLTKAQADKMGKEAQYRQIKEKGPDASLIINNPLVAGLRQQLVTEQAKVSSMQKIFRKDHPDLQAEQANLTELRVRLQAEIQRIQESVKSDYEAANRTEKLLDDSFSAQKEQMTKLQNNLTDFQILKRDAQTNEQLYQALLSRVKEASIAATMVPSNMSVIDPAQLPDKPFKPKTTRDLALGAILGLTLGVGLALLMEHLDDSIESIDDLERSCRLPSLGIVPRLGSDRRISLRRRRKSDWSLRHYLPRLQRSVQGKAEAAEMDLIVFKQPQSMVSEAIRHVYSSIMLSTSGRPPCAIMVTSPNPKDGKTTIVSNLAQSYALNERQVVLIDCDLRKPRLHQIFQIDSQPGVSNYLTGNANLEEILHPTVIPNLTIITAGTKPPSPTNLLNSDTFKELLIQLRERFRHIIIDTPPVLGFADARFVSALVDGVLLVTRHNFTHKSAGRLALQLLSQAPILGAVLNNVSHYGHGYGSYYYQYNYRYYSKYYGDKQE